MKYFLISNTKVLKVITILKVFLKELFYPCFEETKFIPFTYTLVYHNRKLP